MDAVVVGAGIVGAAVADALAADGVRVLVLDRGAPGGGTTATGMGHIVVMDDSPAQLALTSWSRSLFHEIADELPASCELDRRGTLWVAEDAAQLELARAKVERYAAGGIAAELIDGAALSRAEPELRPGLAGAVYVPDDCVVYPRAACDFLLERAVSRGARVMRDTNVTAIAPGAVITSDGRHEADVVVNAAGVNAARLTPGLHVMPRRGHLVLTGIHAGFCHHQIVELGYMQSAHAMTGQSVAFNVQPRQSGQVLIGSSRELTGFDTSINHDIVARMMSRAATFMPRIPSLDVVSTWCGLRPATPDKLPLIGRWDPVPGLWIAAGHEGLGATTSLGTARVLSDLIRGRPTAVDASAFSPARMLGASSIELERR